ncbi:hypothetical protein [Variovorax sp. Root434]|uniref:hypothetical protein n=1 Tax=Variovorax sp. Root434 TaxID=1736536 RepID=UPI0006F1D900|nr:hypothetical protein [Variovorax sp. Root434]KQX34672.1 hypothetical protein ASD05_25805 [Variovorax sp. Root434]
MQTSLKNSPQATEAAAPTVAERIDAIEQFLQQLVLLLEVEPDLNRESVAAWIEITNSSASAHGLQSMRERAAMEQLCSRVLNFPLDVERATPAVRPS